MRPLLDLKEIKMTTLYLLTKDGVHPLSSVQPLHIATGKARVIDCVGERFTVKMSDIVKVTE